ncbi:MAG: site-specific integrase, partial [Muribaculaceae bacterium]|nr:site-specific integrase [Muribaculaceae bacterium]
MTLDDFSSYLLYEQNRSPLTAEAYLRDISQFADYIGMPTDNMEPDLVKTTDVRAWLATLARERRSPRTLRRKAQSLRAFFRFLLRHDIIESNPTRDLSLPKLPKPLPDHIRMEEIEKILSREEY